MKIQAARRDLTYTSVVSTVEMELEWWVQTSQEHNGRPLQIRQWDLMIEPDASLMGWGASCQGRNTRGPWTEVSTSTAQSSWLPSLH